MSSWIQRPDKNPPPLGSRLPATLRGRLSPEELSLAATPRDRAARGGRIAQRKQPRMTLAIAMPARAEAVRTARRKSTARIVALARPLC